MPVDRLDIRVDARSLAGFSADQLRAIFAGLAEVLAACALAVPADERITTALAPRDGGRPKPEAGEKGGG